MIAVLYMFVMGHVFSKVDCELFKYRACLYQPQTLISNSLLIYFRGHYEGQSDFSNEQREKVAKNTLLDKNYQLMELSEKFGIPVLATGSSRVSFNLQDLNLLKTKIKFDDVYLASHSGGYKGLFDFLRNFKDNKTTKIHSVFMLDNFYSTDTSGLSEILRYYYSQGVICSGFVTWHNFERYKSYYSYCRVDGPEKFDHNSSVGPFLLSEFH